MHGLGNDYIVIDNRDNSVKEEEISPLHVSACRALEEKFSARIR